jgi:hypothetical protein
MQEEPVNTKRAPGTASAKGFPTPEVAFYSTAGRSREGVGRPAAFRLERIGLARRLAAAGGRLGAATKGISAAGHGLGSARGRPTAKWIGAAGGRLGTAGCGFTGAGGCAAETKGIGAGGRRFSTTRGRPTAKWIGAAGGRLGTAGCGFTGAGGRAAETKGIGTARGWLRPARCRLGATGGCATAKRISATGCGLGAATEGISAAGSWLDDTRGCLTAKRLGAAGGWLGSTAKRIGAAGGWLSAARGHPASKRIGTTRGWLGAAGGRAPAKRISAARGRPTAKRVRAAGGRLSTTWCYTAAKRIDTARGRLAFAGRGLFVTSTAEHLAQQSSDAFADRFRSALFTTCRAAGHGFAAERVAPGGRRFRATTKRICTRGRRLCTAAKGIGPSGRRLCATTKRVGPGGRRFRAHIKGIAPGSGRLRTTTKRVGPSGRRFGWLLNPATKRIGTRGRRFSRLLGPEGLGAPGRLPTAGQRAHAERVVGRRLHGRGRLGAADGHLGGRLDLLAQHALFFSCEVVIPLAPRLFVTLQGDHAGLGAVALQVQADSALDALQGAGDVEPLAVRVLGFEIGSLLEVHFGLLIAAKFLVGQSAEVVGPRVLAPALDGGGQVLVGFDELPREVRVDSASIHLSQHGVLRVQRGGREQDQGPGQQDGSPEHDTRLLCVSPETKDDARPRRTRRDFPLTRRGKDKHHKAARTLAPFSMVTPPGRNIKHSPPIPRRLPVADRGVGPGSASQGLDGRGGSKFHRRTIGDQARVPVTAQDRRLTPGGGVR